MFKLPKVLNCKAAAEMSCRRRDGTLTARERVTLAIHLLLCAGCRFVEKQFALLEKAAKRLGQRGFSEKSDDEARLSPEAREKMREIIR